MITLDAFATDDVALIGACLEAAVNGPFFPEWEFETLFGLSRSQVRAVSERWPANVADPQTEIAVRNTLANLCGYPTTRISSFSNGVSKSAASAKTLGKDPDGREFVRSAVDGACDQNWPTTVTSGALALRSSSKSSRTDRRFEGRKRMRSRTSVRIAMLHSEP